jgi:methylenetetrahydrofolate reductase (NADPH)
MRIIDYLGKGRPCFSFEFFPPHTDKGVESLFRTVVELKPLEPGFVSCTYPGSATPEPDPEVARRRRLTIDLTRRIREESRIEAMAHLTCSAHTRADLVAILDGLAADGADNLLALRGDPPAIVSADHARQAFSATLGGFSHGSELIGLIRERGHSLCVAAACYPERHVESPDWQSDIRHLKAKVDAGANLLISQLFFDNTAWFDFVVRARDAGIDVPLIPGLMPITSRSGIIRMTELSGAKIPAELRRRLDALSEEDVDGVMTLGIEWTTRQALELLEKGAPGIHFYTLNKSHSTREIVSAIRKRT